MMFHNMDSLETDVRKAIDVAIDRTILAQSLSGGTGTRSLFPDYSPYYADESDPHGHPDDAAAILDEAGWVINAETGKREKDGQGLTINLVAYPHRPGLVIMQPVIQEALEELGMDVNPILTGMDWDETATIIGERTFDLLLWAQHTLDPVWFLNAFFRSDGGNNHANLSSEEVDTKLDALSNAEDHIQRIALAADAQSEILASVPVSNLVTPYWHVSLSDRMANYEPWGSDYYIIRADLFTTEPVSDSNGYHSEEEDHRHNKDEEDNRQEEKHHSEDHEQDHDHSEDDHSGASLVTIVAHVMLILMGTAVLLA